MKNDKLIKIKENLKEFFKSPKDVVSFFLPIVITLCLLIPVPYYIKMGGGTIDLNDKISIEDETKTKGSLEALYVKEAKGVVLTYLLSYVIPSYDREKQEQVHIEEEEAEEYAYREKLMFTSSLDAATKVAFEKAGKKVEIASSKFYVIYIDKASKTNLKVGDQILKVNGEYITDYNEMSKIISTSNKAINITVKRDGELVETTNELIEIDNEKKLGVVLSNEVTYKSDPEVDFKFNGKQAGPSGGLMIALTIYDKLVEEDITKGKKVVGTGTIDIEGNIGEIGGVKHKLLAASRKKADIVLVPKENYKEAKRIKEDKNYDFKLISVSTFDEALKGLEKN